MQMPVAIGVLIAVMALVTFSGWFYGYATGMRELVLDDKFFNYRIAFATLSSILFMVAMFWVIATVNECPNQTNRIGGQTRDEVFAGLKCDGYLRIKASADNLFQPKDKTIDQSL